ncbi:MAG: hypothetical protein O2854_03895 [Chloroflexi bacterium]|nr:hypothetical protein [Chloroflexota bacterium]
MGATYPAPAVGVRGETLALSTTLATLGVPSGMQQFTFYSPSADFQLHLNPALLDVNFYDASATEGQRFIKAGSTSTLLADLTDRASGTGTGTVMDSMTTSDYLYLCWSDIVGGLYINVKSANGTSNTMVVEYRKNDNTWASLSITDNTDTGASLAQDGTVTWTAPTDWKATALGGPQGIITNANAAGGTAAAPAGTDPSGTIGFWMRVSFSGAGLDSDTEIEEAWSLNKATDRGYFRVGAEVTFSIDRRAVGAIEAILTASTSTAQITWTRNHI